MNNERYNQIIGDAYKSYQKEINRRLENWIDIQEGDIYEGTSLDDSGRIWTQEEFINKCKTEPDFSEKWGIQIEERELTTVRERKKYDKYFDVLIGEYLEHHEKLDKRGVPRKITTITYNNETVINYE